MLQPWILPQRIAVLLGRPPAMSKPRRTSTAEVAHLLINACLRDALEPYFDEALERIESGVLSTPQENEYLASMLAWERAPSIPICEWFDPVLELPPPGTLGDAQLHELLWETIYKLHSKRIVLDFADHLTDRELYALICRDILPTHEKKIDLGTHFLHWDCADIGGDPAGLADFP